MSEPTTDRRKEVADQLFPDVAVTRFDAAQIDDHLDPGATPTVVLMNPPFSALANVDRRRMDAALRHVSSAPVRLAEGGRLVAITPASLAPDDPAWREDFTASHAPRRHAHRYRQDAGQDGRASTRRGRSLMHRRVEKPVPPWAVPSPTAVFRVNATYGTATHYALM
jgi:predicted RNA methylase